MTVGYHLNVEILVKRIVEAEIDKLSESNVSPLRQDDEGDAIKTLDDDAFEANFSHGFTALVFMCVYMEAVLNSIIRENDAADYPYDPNIDKKERERRLAPILRRCIEDKIKKELGIRFEVGTEECAYWDKFKHILDVRDALIHYKTNYIQDALVPDPRMWVVGSKAPVVPQPSDKVDPHSVGLVFTKHKMSELWQVTQRLVDYIVRQSGCIYTPGVRPVQSDGKDGFASYVVNLKAYEETYSDLEN